MAKPTAIARVHAKLEILHQLQILAGRRVEAIRHKQSIRDDYTN